MRAQNGTQPITVTDLTKIVQLGTASFSHNGKWVAFVTKSIVADDDKKNEYAYHTRVWLVPADGSEAPRPLTAEATNGSQPVWSANDDQIAFVRTVKSKSQIFLLSLKGGEPVQVTADKYGASSPQFSPDGKKILYSVGLSYTELLKDSVLNPNRGVPAWPVEKPGFKANLPQSKAKQNADGSLDEIRAFLAQDEADNKVKTFNKLNFEGEATTEPEFSFNHYFITDAKPGSKGMALTHGFQNYNGAVFTPDGKTIILSAGADSLTNPDRTRVTAIYSMPAAGGALTPLIKEAGMSLSNGEVSPDGRYLVYQAGKEMTISISQLLIYDFKDPAKRISIPVDRVITGTVWSADSKYLYFTAQSNGSAPVYKASVSNPKPVMLGTFDEGLGNLDVSKKQLVYVKTEVANPFELYVSDLNGKEEKRLTSFNADWIKDKKLSFPEKKYYTNSKGLKVEYWVMKPTNFDPNKKYPVMLQIHGGPTAMWGPGENTMWHEFQYFCAKGYGVVYANPRGSGGYGIDFTKANYQDWGDGPTEDVLAALDGALAEGWGDSKQTVATGGSYAGYLTGWLAGHTKRFAAISSQRGVYDLTTFFGEANAWTLVPVYFGGYPWEEHTRAVLAKESPFTYVNNITTPYLIIHGETDLRTGIVQGEMMYKALKVLNRPVEYVQHPGGTHELVRSGNVRQRIDQMLRIYEFFERYITH
ncbi:peptidase S9 family protein [Mucilaginibacter xinganensis]|uniref:Peptidase S9 family protein n=1 Tax=Mucilaginibacter xinganensis TaxID=1234841 RepID=A0A223P1K6_9SPHI|nr:peptidase S9 family protein [Mucilaginibacter xinganensis]